MKNLLAYTSLLFCGLAFVTICPAQIPVKKIAVKIGVIAPLTAGPISSGESFRNSIILSDEQNDLNNSVEFIFEDDRFEPKNTVTAAKKLIKSDRVQGLIVYGSPTSLAVNAIAEQEKIPMVGVSIVRAVVEGKTFVVKHWLSSEKQSELVVQEARLRGLKRVAIVSTINDAMLTLRDKFVESKSFEIVLDEEYPKEEFDFRTLVTKIVSKSPSAVYVLLYPPQTGVFVKALRQGGFAGEVFGVYNFEDRGEVTASGGALIGSWYVHGDDSTAKKYYQSYQQRFGEYPALGGTNGYDIAKLCIEAVASGDINHHLHTVKDFSGTYGTYSATGSNDFDMRAAVKIVTADGFEKKLFAEN